MNTETTQHTPPTLSIEAAQRVLGINSKNKLAKHFGIDPSVITRWNGTLPPNYVYRLMHEIQADLPGLLERVQ